ncbi:MAG TPA: type II secretion system protein GspG [Pyrinomonadaceae bacterium]|nr:type II secretion system protein GspG [Pyrinomonadaceae bacterium]
MGTKLALLACSCFLVAATCAEVRADLSQSQARKALTRVAGFELKSNAVRVKSVSTNGSSASVTADIRTAFRFQADKEGRWRVADVRTGQDSWEDISLIAAALGGTIDSSGCNAPDPPLKGKSATNPSVKRARCLLGNLFGIDVPSDAVRIQEVTLSPIPLATEPSALVVAWVRVDVQLLNDKSGWHAVQLRTGNRDWVKLENVVAGVNQRKQERARADMAVMATALEKFHKERGSYVVSDSHAIAIDFLNPRYLAQIIRVDPWRRPYKYQGDQNTFTLRSLGPDGKAATPDDIELTQSAR